MDKIGPMTKKEYICKMEEAYQMVMRARCIVEECDAIVHEYHFKNISPILERIGCEIHDVRNEHMKEWG